MTCKLLKAEILVGAKKEYMARLQNAVESFSQHSETGGNQKEVGDTKLNVGQDQPTDTDYERECDKLQHLRNENLELHLQIKEFEAQIQDLEIENHWLELKSQDLQDALDVSHKEADECKKELDLVRRLERRNGRQLQSLEIRAKEKSEECTRLQAELDEYKPYGCYLLPFEDIGSPEWVQSQFSPWMHKYM